MPACMHTPRAPFALLDFPAPGLSRRLFHEPTQVIVARHASEVRAVLDGAERAANDGRYAVGFVAYEAAPAFDRAFRVRPAETPLAWFGIFDNAVTFPFAESPTPDAVRWSARMSRDNHNHAVDALRDAIARGDVYQVNLTFPLDVTLQADTLEFYESLRTAQPGYCAYLDIGTQRVLSLSPELFFQRTGDSVVMRPMKGTLRRGRWSAEDVEREDQLARSGKDRAENLMIVDLIRNDLGRIATFGSVTVPQLFDIEKYPTVFQMTSTVHATLRPRTSLVDVFAALFPSGSVTGAPKISAMRFIEKHEQTARGVYCGALGVIEPGGSATFSVAIRTLWIDVPEQTSTYGVGGGVTWDSRSDAEYEEALSKAAVLTHRTRPFDLLETMRMQDGVIARLDRHVSRINESAAYFGRVPPGASVREALQECARSLPRGAWRVRALAAESGVVRLQTSPLENPPAQPLFALAERAVDSEDVMLFHKTTSRERYETERAARPDLFDILYANERGELTEFTRGNLVLELTGRRWTPPRTSGLLAGTFRAELLEHGIIAERVLYEEDLRSATKIWLINSVREWTLVRQKARLDREDNTHDET
jgi:para-aminobenzoate synthetase/4-amino-4-deoxychorismate lyase